MAPTNHIAHTSDAEFDALADLFLGERSNGHSREHVPPPPIAPSAPAHTTGHTPSVRTAIDLVVQGHLPVRAGPWIARYAAERAAQAGSCVALIRLHQGHATVDVIAPGPTEAVARSKAPSLPNAISEALAIAKECIVAVEAVEEIDLAAREGIASITVLTAPNEAAVVEAYRVIKTIGARVSHATDTAEAPHIRIAVMGADADRAAQVHRKLSDASSAFIGRDVQLAACAHRIEPTAAANLFRGDTSIAATTLLDTIIRAAAPTPAPTPPTPTTPTAPPTHARTETAPRAHPTPLPPTRAATATPKDDLPQPDPFALIPGLTPIALPDTPDPRVRIARDARGGLHLVRVDSDAPEEALAGLLAVEAWVLAHRALIEMALGAPIIGEPTVHIITERIESARSLMHTRIRTHAMVRATGPFAAVALNNPDA